MGINLEDFKMAGYDGFSKSNNAVQAELDGKFPKSLAVKIIAKKYSVSQKRAEKFLSTVPPCEWHHSSKNYNKVDYFQTDLEEDQVAFLRSLNVPEQKKFEKITLENQEIKWIEWSGSLKKPKATEKTAVGKVEILTETTVLVLIEGTAPFKKRLSTNGFSFKEAR
jgi:hypothetical protein